MVMQFHGSLVPRAKLNLHLVVGPLRLDGFHRIESVFCLTSLADSVDIDVVSAPKFSVLVEGLDSLCLPGKDTLTKTSGIWHEVTGEEVAIHIRIRKGIPSMAGLGGGSSDAASLLLALDGLHPVGNDALWEIAEAIGSDVSFFLSRYPFAWVTGRGEKVERVEGMPPLWAVVVMPLGFSRSTGQAFADLDRLGLLPGPTKETVLGALHGGFEDYRTVMRNDFSRVSGEKGFYRRLEDCAVGLDGYCSLTGSGAAWFFLSKTRKMADSFKKRLDAVMKGLQKNWLTRIG